MHNIVINKIQKLVTQLDLCLKGKTVLTEAATGLYAVTPWVAALAGATVYAYGKSSQHGSWDVIKFEHLKWQNLFPKLKVCLINDLCPNVISKADIITNSGHLRPLDRYKLQYAKEQLIIPLMFEDWELREEDIDLAYCKEKRISIVGTNERYEYVNVFDYLGEMVLHHMHKADICVTGNKFILYCNNHFGPYIADFLSNVCDKLGVISINEMKELYPKKIEWLGNFPHFEIPEMFKSSDCVIISTSPFSKKWIGKNSHVEAKNLLQQLDNPYLLRFIGDIDEAELKYSNIPYFPNSLKTGHMGSIPSDIGSDSIVKLQVGSLKASELALRGDFSHPLVQKIL